jgi:hypothetical protein
LRDLLDTYRTIKKSAFRKVGEILALVFIGGLVLWATGFRWKP